MSAGIIAFIVALSTSVWAYVKLQGRTGYGNSKSAVTGAAVVFVLAFIVIFSLAHLLPHN